MRNTENNRSARLYFRVTPKEFERINAQYKKTTCRALSEYLRRIVLQKPVQVVHRNQSLDALMEELSTLRVELNAIGNNYNQAVKRLHTLKEVTELKTWLIVNESSRKVLLEKVAAIKEKITSINDAWLHE